MLPSFSEEDGVSLNDAFLQYYYSDTHYIKVGKGKFPLSRLYLISSTKQLFAERPYYIYAWGNVLRTYSATNLAVGGKFFESTLSYDFSVSKVWRYGDELYLNDEVNAIKSTPFYATRVEWSPPG